MSDKPHIFVASDHAGFALKDELKTFLELLGYTTTDCGADTLQEDDDYPDFIARAAEAISKHPGGARAIVIGKSGQGEAIVANRYVSVRAAVYYGGDVSVVSLSREHNDANILSLGAGFLSLEEAKEAVKIFLETSFSGDERHIRRIEKIEHLHS